MEDSPPFSGYHSKSHSFGLSGGVPQWPESRRWLADWFSGDTVRMQDGPLVWLDRGEGVPLSTSVFHIVTSGWPGPDGTVWVPGELARRREHGFTDTHNRLSSCCQSVVWFLTQRPGAVPGLVTGYLPEADADCRKARESVSNPGRKSAIGRTVRTLGCSRPSTGRVSTTLENGCLDSIP